MTVLTAGPDIDGFLGIDTGKSCPSNLIPTTGTWAPACDQPQSPNFPKVYVTQPGFYGIAFTGPGENAIASGAFACPYCYTNGGAVQAWSYNGPNRGKYCTDKEGVVGALKVKDMYFTQTEAYAATDSCVAVGVWVLTAGVADGYARRRSLLNGDPITIPTGSEGSLCMGDDSPLCVSPSRVLVACRR